MVNKNKKKSKKGANKHSYVPKKNIQNTPENTEFSTDLNENTVLPAEDALVVRGINIRSKEDMMSHSQTYPPTKVVSTLFPENKFPEGQILDHPLEINSKRRTSETKTQAEVNWLPKLQSLREAGEIHRQVRNYMQRVIKPGMKMIDICELLEDKNRQLIGIDPKNPLKKSIGFPTGVSLNNVAAHYTPNANDKTVLKKEDIVKIDFGTQVNGQIIDCAFTATFDPKYDAFINVVKEATETGIKEMGVDVRLCDIGAAIRETMTAEVEVGDEVVQVRPIRNLNGHSIGEYSIHAGKTVPLYDNGDQTKMDEGELFAIETFGSTGKGLIKDSERLEVSHYMKNKNTEYVAFDRKNVRDLLNFINKQFGTLAFCKRWIDRGGLTRYLFALKKLVDAGIVTPYPALEDVRGSLTAQYEHTIMLRPTCKEVVSRGFDF